MDESKVLFYISNINGDDLRMGNGLHFTLRVFRTGVVRGTGYIDQQNEQ
jgi:hypothetical protein